MSPLGGVKIFFVSTTYKLFLPFCGIVFGSLKTRNQHIFSELYDTRKMSSLLRCTTVNLKALPKLTLRLNNEFNDRRNEI